MSFVHTALFRKRQRQQRQQRQQQVKMILTEEKVEAMRVGASRVKCPFLRRRATDVLDVLGNLAEWLQSRHKRLDFRPVEISLENKLVGLSAEQVMPIISKDFTRRKYYITGALSRELYRDDCRFEGPDPDLPIVGLKKYTDAASNLFDRKKSTCDLLSIEVLDSRRIQAEWRLEGVLRLPWKPAIKAFLGRTTFSLDDNGLIQRHEEDWSITAWDAFISTLLFRSFGAPPAPSTAHLLTLSREERKF